MARAIRLAEKALSYNEVPVGAIIVKNNIIIGQGYNQKEFLNDPTAHAEIIAITSAASTEKNWRLNDSTLYVTKEPCPMCAGAIINARISKLVFGAYDDDKGCCGSLYQLCGDKRLDSRTAVRGGVDEEICSSLLSSFFKKQRS
tara:strand:- start:169 stop:600 length:432 start_codon:yes stop_codon:yes gene_type:complete